MRGRSLLSIAIFLAHFLSFDQALAQSENTVTVEVDATTEGRPLNPVWAYFGYDEANYTTLPEGRELLRRLAGAHETKVHTRTHFLFNSGDGAPKLKWGSTNVYSEDVAGNPVYDFSILDGIMDATTEAGVVPLFELGFTPKALSPEPEPYENSSASVLDSGSFYPPSDLDKWSALVMTWAEHASARYPLDDSQTNWLWELWNEPDIGYFKGTVEDYGRLYDHTEAALHAVLPDAMLGGPAVASPERTFLAEFLSHCASGVNAVTGESGTRLDLVTFHAKGGVTEVDEHVRLDLGNQLRLHQMGFETIVNSAFSDRPIIISEADPDGCAACPSSTHRYLDYRNFPAYGAYEVAMMKRSLELAEEMDVDLRGLVTWAFTFPGTPYFSGHRALTTNGIDLPVLKTFELLGKLEGARVPVASEGARTLSELLDSGVRTAPEIDALATSSKDQIQILVWNYHDDLVAVEPAGVTVRVSVPRSFGTELELTHERVDDAHGSAFPVWQAQGSPASPSPAELQELEDAMSSTELEPARRLSVQGGIATISFDLPRFGVSLLTLSSKPGAGSSTPGSGCSCHASGRPAGGAGAVLLSFLLLAARLRRRATVWS